MKPQDRYEAERQQNRENRIDEILDAAKTLFAQKGIEKTTMQDIANEANLGVATVFRMFSKKEKIAVSIATLALEEILAVFQRVAQMEVTCLKKIEALFDHFIENLRNERGEHIMILENFDVYSSRLKEPVEDIEQFKKVYKEVSKTYASIIEEGKRDGSIRSTIDISASLITLLNTFAIFARKLAIQKSIFFIELDLEPEKQLKLLRQIMIEYLTADG